MERDLRKRLSEALAVAVRQQDRVAIAAYRSTLAAIANAEAVEGPATATPRMGLGAGEALRKELSGEELVQIVRKEVDELISAAEEYERFGRSEPARRLRGEAAALEPYL